MVLIVSLIPLSLDRYCPGGPDSDFDYSTQSYTGYEPTSMRAIRARYDPYEQTRGRVEQLKMQMQYGGYYQAQIQQEGSRLHGVRFF